MASGYNKENKEKCQKINKEISSDAYIIDGLHM